LERNEKKEGTERRPSFVSIKTTQGLQRIPLVASSEEAGTLQPGGLYGVSTNGVNFSLYANREKNQDAGPSAKASIIGEFELPSYYDSLGPIKQVLRTPPALVADTAIYASMFAVLYAPYWWPALNCAVHAK
jgi:hypothetical protein